MPRRPATSGPSELSRVRRAFSRRSLWAFAQLYLRHHLKIPPAAFHREVMDELAAGVRAGGLRYAAAMPEGYGKSTMAALALPLWCAAFTSHRHIVGITASPLAARARGDAALAELLANPRLTGDYPHLRSTVQLPASRSGSTRDLLIGGRVRLVFAPRLSPAVGLRSGGMAPDLVVVDDLEAELSMRSTRARERTAAWWERSVFRALEETASLVWVGTLGHPHELLARMVDSSPPGWRGRRYGAIAAYPERIWLWIRHERVSQGLEEWEGATGPAAAAALLATDRERMLAGSWALWPAKESVEMLLVQKARMGWLAFDARKQSRPRLEPDHRTVYVCMGDIPREDRRPPFEWRDDAGLARVAREPDPSTARLWPDPPLPVRAAPRVDPWEHDGPRVVLEVEEPEPRWPEEP